ncbi:MAG: hypothetical protein AAFY38_16700 [Pseudomonadota bacterium]
MRILSTSLALICLAAPAFAEGTAIPMPYAVFEEAVPHMDLASCPPALPQTDSFCRVSLSHHAAHVFAFSLSGDSPLIGHAEMPFAEVAAYAE